MTQDERLEAASKEIDEICERYHIALCSVHDEETGEEFVAYAPAEECIPVTLSA